jgi:hypothetical protein
MAHLYGEVVIPGIPFPKGKVWLQAHDLWAQK